MSVKVSLFLIFLVFFFLPIFSKSVFASFNFGLSCSGDIELNLKNTTVATSTIYVSLISGPSSLVYLSVSDTDLPDADDTTFSFSPASCAPDCSSVLTISLPSTTPAGTYYVAVKGEDPGGSSAFVDFSLTVKTTECGDGSCDFPETSSTCPADCGCNPNGICEVERGENSWNCSDDCKTVTEAHYCVCRTNPKHLGGAGFVPCGRKADDLDTSNCECCPCTLCHAFLMFKRVTGFLIRDLFFPLLLLAIIIAGLLHIFGAIKIADIIKAKAVLTAGAIGTLVIFTSWITVNLSLYFMTHQKTGQGIATIFSERWNEVSCNYPAGCSTAYCGDGIVQRPNGEGVNEECELEESWEAFKARADKGEAVDIDNNGVVDKRDYFALVCSCDEDCYSTADVSSCCGNGRWEAGEGCDFTISEANWLTPEHARDLDGDGDRDSDDYHLFTCYCKDNCTYTPGGKTLNKFFNGFTTYSLNILSGQTSTAPVCLPENTKVCGASIEIRFSGSQVERTPYIWVPLSNKNRVVQMKTEDGSFVAMYGKEDGVITCSAGDYCIWDCIANCATNNPTWKEREKNANCHFNDPSRITVVSDQQVWVANRIGNSVTQLITTGSGGGFTCKGTYTSDDGNIRGARGATFDRDGNIWVGGYNDGEICKFKPDGTRLFCHDNLAHTYGMIADSFGNVWISARSEKVIKRIDIDSCTVSSCPAISSSKFFKDKPYGIGIDNEGDIWVGDWKGYRIREIDGEDPGGAGVGNLETTCGEFPGCCTGIAVDGNNNVWFNAHGADTTYMIEGGNCNKVHSFSDVCPLRAHPHGVAIDADNNAWVVCRQGEVVKLKFNGTDIEKVLARDLDAACNSGTGMGASYNYSDMTGFRTPSLSLCIEGKCFPFSVGLPLTGFEKELQAALKDCAGGERVDCNTTPDCNIDFSGVTSATSCCKVPITIQASLGGGQYDVYNLDINYNPPP